MGFSLSISEKDCLCVAGDIGFDNVVDACNQGVELIHSMGKITVDLSGINQADSSCLAMIVEWVRVARSEHKDIEFVGTPRGMMDLGRVCGLDTILPFDKVLAWQ